MPRLVCLPALGLLFLAGCHDQAAAPAPAPERDQASMVDLLDHRGLPAAAEDWSFLPFSDQGSWLGWSLPSEDRFDDRGGFGGPFRFDVGRWLASRLIGVALGDGPRTLRWQDAQHFETEGLPGRLRQRARLGELDVTLRLWIDSARATVIELDVRHDGPTSRRLDVAWTGGVFAGQATLESVEGGLRLEAEDGARLEVVADRPMQAPVTDGARYSWSPAAQVELLARGRTTVALAVGWALAGEPAPDRVRLQALLADRELSKEENAARWRAYLDAVDVGTAEDPRQVVAAKALQTLVGNWRAPAGRLRHSGLFPSSNVGYFNGFWAWDSWKHAVALVHFDPALAKEQVRAMFDHQDASGMIADVVYLDPAEDNWRDTKPPLAGWAIETIYRATGDLDFARDLYPRLERYHAFWYADRDHDGDGLCEYGSTDGTLVAARWESGMDNAVRFDRSRMLENGPRAWSLDQESVDLNSYLFREKRALEVLARALGDETVAARWSAEADQLGEQIRASMFDQESGWFYDIGVEDGGIVRVQGPEGWIPLWTGVASREQAARVRQTMLDPDKFRTYVPFPTVARDDPGFSDGYWRGLVWLDQAYFAIGGLRRYGYHDDAEALTAQLLKNLEGASEPGMPLYENYHPLTGEGRNVKHFSWTAAHLLLLTQGDAR